MPRAYATVTGSKQTRRSCGPSGVRLPAVSLIGRPILHPAVTRHPAAPQCCTASAAKQELCCCSSSSFCLASEGCLQLPPQFSSSFFPPFLASRYQVVSSAHLTSCTSCTTTAGEMVSSPCARQVGHLAGWRQTSVGGGGCCSENANSVRVKWSPHLLWTTAAVSISQDSRLQVNL